MIEQLTELDELLESGPMLSLSNLSLRRGRRELLHEVSCTLHAGQKIGVTGANGVGKSSLFALIRNELQPDAGELSLSPGSVIAHVAQETPAVDKPAIEFVIDGDTALRKLERRIRAAERRDDGAELAHLHAELDNIDGYTAPTRAAQLMHGLGFSGQQEQVPVAEFSGGWRMRLNLAQALMCRSDLLLLDEPTNHLDLEAVLWLEDWLAAYRGTLLLISHDRDFLDRVVTHIAHIEHRELRLYTGNYSEFETRRAAELAHQQAAYEKQQREIAHMRAFVNRFRAKATKARQAQSRLKALERMELITQAHVDSPFHFEFRIPARLPNPLLRLDDVAVGYGENTVLDGIRLSVAEGDRIGLLGHNGAGKSTLIKLLAGDLLPLRGERMAATHLDVGYFAQHQLDQLDPEASPLLHLQRLDPKATEQQMRDFLGGFGFSGDMASTAVKPFSGGEKARLALALIVYQRPNLLLLDEPTNHLDLDMRLALTTALQDFAGAMVIVSHDRHLLRTVSDSFLLVHAGELRPFDGDLEDYRRWVREQNSMGDRVSPEPPANGPSRKRRRQESAGRLRRLQPLRRQVATLEKKMEELSQESEQLQGQLADTELYQSDRRLELGALLARQASIARELQTTEAQWLQASEELEVMQGEP